MLFRADSTLFVGYLFCRIIYKSQTLYSFMEKCEKCGFESEQNK